MPSFLSETDIANSALDMLSEAPIASIDDAGPLARLMKRNFWIVAASLMRTHPWNFCMARVRLPAEAAAPPFGFAHAYRMPQDCLRLRPLTENGEENGRDIRHRIEGEFILTDAPPPLAVNYHRRIDNPGLFDPQFCEVLAAMLAQKVAHSITGKQSFAQTLGEKAAQLMLQAQMTDALEGSPEEIVDDDWLRARA